MSVTGALLIGCGRRVLAAKSLVDAVSHRGFSVSAISSLKSNLPIKWVRPEPVPCIHPEKSGDLEPVIQLEYDKMFPKEFQDSEELKNCDEKVRKLFTLEYFPRNRAKDILNEEYLKQVKRHSLDVKSPEAIVARMTARIRTLQAVYATTPKNKKMKIQLKELIDKRKRWLLQMREQDYKCFEFLLDKLNLEYKPQPQPDVYLRVERKRSLRMLTQKYCDDIVKRKMDELKGKYDSRKEEFLNRKIEKLKWIMREEKECGVAPTVTEEDVAKAEKQLEEFRRTSKEDAQSEEY